MGFFDRLRQAAERATQAVTRAVDRALDAAAEALDVTGEARQPDRPRPAPRRAAARPPQPPAPAPAPKPKRKLSKAQRERKRKSKGAQRVPAGQVYVYKGKRYKGGRFAPAGAKPSKARAPAARVPAGQTLTLPDGRVLKGGQFVPNTVKATLEQLQTQSKFAPGRELFDGTWIVATPATATHWMGALEWEEDGQVRWMQTRIDVDRARVERETDAQALQRRENGASKEVVGPYVRHIIPLRRGRDARRSVVPD
jgi:hypothetical protein